jgi:soluble lytic murein transglycosylase
LETRDYVKKVLSNTTNYATILTRQPQSLKARLGSVGPRQSPMAEVNKDLP